MKKVMFHYRLKKQFNNTIVRQNERSLVLNVCELEPEDSRGVYKNISVDETI